MIWFEAHHLLRSISSIDDIYSLHICVNLQCHNKPVTAGTACRATAGRSSNVSASSSRSPRCSPRPAPCRRASAGCAALTASCCSQLRVRQHADMWASIYNIITDVQWRTRLAGAVPATSSARLLPRWWLSPTSGATTTTTTTV